MFNPLPDFIYQHVDGDAITVPDWQLAREHDHDEVTLPVPGSPKLKIPCAHWRLQQSATAKEVARVTCQHLLPEVHRDNSRHIVYHAPGQALQQEVAAAVDRLLALGVRMGTELRPLRIYNRPLAPAPRPQDGNNPLWSQYHGGLHAITVHHDPVSARPSFRDTLHHELGHATLGHSFLHIDSDGGPHRMDDHHDPALALAEGWAHFVALVLRFEPTQAIPDGYNGNNWERRRMGVPLGQTIESNVARALWDLYDVPNDTPAQPPQPARDGVTLSFAKLFEVFSPTLATLRDGPTIHSAIAWFDRLKVLNPAQAAAITKVQKMHFG